MQKWMRLIVVAFVFISPGITRALSAQELRGTVRLAESNEPATGVIIEALDPATNARIASTLTDTRGYFILKLTAPRTIAVRGLRIGQRPTEFGTFTLAAGEVRTEAFALSGAAIALERISVVGRSVCGRARAQDARDARDARNAQVVTLLEEARKAIRSTQLQSTEGELSAVWTLRSQLTSLQGRPLEEPTVQAFSSGTGRPFRSLPPGLLAEVGYLSIADDGYSFYAPDAEVLLSESFVETHCFQAEPWTKDARDWVGIGFKPAESRPGVVGIRGTLWLDRRSAELQLLEFDYANLPNVLRTSRAGGTVGFLRLASGIWLVNEWSIRMPRVAEVTIPSRGAGRGRIQQRVQRVNALAVTGGDVREIRQGERVLYAAANAGDVVPVVIARSAADMAELCPSPLGVREGVMWGVLRDSLGAPVGARALRLEWREDLRVLGADQRGWTPRRAQVTTGSDGQWMVCGVAQGAVVQLTPMDALARVPMDSLGVEVVLRTAAPAGVATGTVFGRVVDSLRAPVVPSAEVRVLGGTQRAVADAEGRFALDGLPPGVHELLVLDDELLFLRVPLPTARVRVDADGSAEPAVLRTPSPRALFAAACGREPSAGEGLLIGELRDVDDITRRGVTVRASWSRTIVSANNVAEEPRSVESVSDSLGRFVLCGVPSEGEVSQVGNVATYASGEFTLTAGGNGLASGAVTTRLANAPFRRRDLVVASAQQGRAISGLVRDGLGRPVADATVSIAGSDSVRVRTNAEGRWTLAGVPMRSAQLQVRALRYLPMLIDLDPVDGKIEVAEIRLENAPQVMETVNVRGIATSTTAAGFEERKRSYGFGTFLDESTLRQQAVVTAEYVASRTPRARAGNGELALEQAGSGFAALTTCKPRWFVDGVDFGKPPADEERSLLLRAVRIEIYRASLAPPQFNDFDGCGVVVIWTR